jgi:rhodanese-related sulfurtransferase
MKNITPQELCALMHKKKINLVEVRKDHEVEQGIIDGAMHVPMSLVNEWLPSQNIESHWVFYCHVGVRSGQAGLIAENLGFKNIYNLSGGVVAWCQSDFELIK